MIRLSVLTTVVLLSLISCKKAQEKIQPSEERITESVYASGIVKSKNQYQVFSAVNGIVAEIYVSKGDSISKNAPLMHLSNTTARLNIENAGIAANYSAVNANTEKLNELRLGVDQAKAKMDNDLLMAERQRNLWAQQIGTRNDLDQRELALKNSTDALQTAKMRYAQLEKQLSFQARQSEKNLEISKNIAGDYNIKSEHNGRVYSILKEVGEMVNTQTPVALIGDASDFMLELQVDEYDIARIIPGQKIFLSMDSYKGQVFEAIVQKIDPIMNEKSKSFTVEAGFVKQPPALYPNLTCEANIVIVEKSKALTIPRNFLLDSNYVLMENNEKRKVETGLKDYQKVEILSGITAKDILLKPGK